MNNETPVGATCTNDGERWCWASVVDSEGTWLSKTEAESTSGKNRVTFFSTHNQASSLKL